MVHPPREFETSLMNDLLELGNASAEEAKLVLYLINKLRGGAL